MSITFKKGNVVDALLDGEVDYIAHCCNNKGVMGSGVALEIKNRIPEAYEAYINGPLELGYYSIGGNVVNLVAQDGYGKGKRFVNYGALANTFQAVMSELWYNKGFDKVSSRVKIGIPYKMASDRAGGDWNIVLELIEYTLSPWADVVIYELE